jgi:hypothetical protein
MAANDFHGRGAVFTTPAPQIKFSGPVTAYRDRRLPETATPVSHAALIEAFDLGVPLPRTIHVLGRFTCSDRGTASTRRGAGA